MDDKDKQILALREEVERLKAVCPVDELNEQIDSLKGENERLRSDREMALASSRDNHQQKWEVIQGYDKMKAERDALLLSNATLREALEFYRREWVANADGDLSSPHLTRTWMEPTDKLLEDEGRVAEKALTPTSQDLEGK